MSHKCDIKHFIVGDEAYCVNGFDGYWNVPTEVVNRDNLQRMALILNLDDPEDENLLLSMAEELIRNIGILFSARQVFERKGEDEIPTKVKFLKNDKCVALLEMEPWYRLGGPRPYSDSYTFSLYFTSNRAKEIENIFSDISRDFGLRIVKIIRASKSPREEIILSKQKSKIYTIFVFLLNTLAFIFIAIVIVLYVVKSFFF